MPKTELTAAEVRAYRRLALAAREVERNEKRRKQRVKTKADARREEPSHA